MLYDIRLTPAAKAVADSLPVNQRRHYEDALEYLRRDPLPIPGSSLVREVTEFGRRFLSYYDGRLPYIVRYQVWQVLDERGRLVRGCVNILLVLDAHS